jgi:hypothetical protein
MVLQLSEEVQNEDKWQISVEVKAFSSEESL